MNNVHDCGGMQNMGSINIEINEPLFHEQWEKDVFSTTLLFFMGEVSTVDEFRFTIETMSVGDYMETSYYDHWLHAIEILGYKYNLFSKEDVQSKMKELSV